MFDNEMPLLVWCLAKGSSYLSADLIWRIWLAVLICPNSRCPVTHFIHQVEECTLSKHCLPKIISIMSATGGTFRSTPGRGQGRGQVPVFENSPSGIPRPKLESQQSSAMQSEAGTSTLSASRQKQSKRDEVYALKLESMTRISIES